MKMQAVLFDLDGTLLNTLDDLTDSVNAMMKKRGWRCHTADEIRGFVGNGVYQLIRCSAPATASEDEVRDCAADYGAYYTAHCDIKTRPYDGIMELLRALKQRGVRTAVVSNNPDPNTNALCAKLFGGLTDTVMGESAQFGRKPDTPMIREAMRRIGALPDTTLYVGDSEVDARAAAAVGLPFIGVSWGYRDVPLLHELRAARVIDHPSELLTLVDEGI